MQEIMERDLDVEKEKVLGKRRAGESLESEVVKKTENYSDRVVAEEAVQNEGSSSGSAEKTTPGSSLASLTESGTSSVRAALSKTEIELSQANELVLTLQHQYKKLASTLELQNAYISKIHAEMERARESESVLKILLKSVENDAANSARKLEMAQSLPTMPQLLPILNLSSSTFEKELICKLEVKISDLECQNSSLQTALAAAKFGASVSMLEKEELSDAFKSETFGLKAALAQKDSELEELNESLDTLQKQISFAMDASTNFMREKDEEIERLRGELEK